MKPKFKTYNKGRFTQYFGGSPASNPTQYTNRGNDGHSGVDSYLGWDQPVVVDNDCYVYKTILAHQSNENWQGVYTLYNMGNDTAMEIIQGHFNKILVNEGEWLPEGAVIGLEGNRGYVFSNGVQITPQMQMSGDRRGTHTHTAYRPVLKVNRIKKGEYYLQTVTGKNYKDKDGYYYQIIHKNNGYRGCINPFLYAIKEETNAQKLSFLSKLLPWIKSKYA